MTRSMSVVTCDLTDTLLKFRAPLFRIYGEISLSHFAAKSQSRISADKLSALLRDDSKMSHCDSALKDSFKRAYSSVSADYPSFGFAAGLSHDQWWNRVLTATFTAPVCECLCQTLATANALETDLFSDDTAIDNATICDSETMTELFDAIKDEYRTADGYHVFDDTLPFLHQLSERRSADALFVTGVISNATELYRDSVLPALGLAQFFDFFCMARVFGYSKPDTRIFEAALREAQHFCADGGRTAFHRLHVGDSLLKDAIGALGAGWHSAWIVREPNGRTVAELENDAKEAWHKATGDQWSDELTQRLQIVHSLSEIKM